MAETKETVIFEVDVSSLTKSISEARTELDAYSVALQKSTEETGKNSEATIEAKAAYDAQRKSVQQQEGALLRITQAQKSLGGSINDVIKNYDASGKSIDQNRKVLNALTAEYVKTQNPTKEFTNRIKSISDELKKQEGAIGDNRRNVGNYASAFEQFGGILQGASGNLGNAVTGIKSMNAAFAANPILGVVTLLTTLFQILQQNAEAADVIKFAFDGVNKGLQSLADLLVAGIKQLSFLKDAFDKPGETIKNFGQLIVDNILNRFKAFGVFIDAVSLALEGKFSEAAIKALDATTQLTLGITNVVTNFTNATKEGYEAARALDEFTLSSAKTNSEIRLSRIEIEALTKTLKDRTKSEEERIKIAERIANLEIKNADRTAKIARDQLAAEELRLKGLAISADQEAKLLDLRTSVKEAEAEKSIAISQKQTRINILLDKQANDALKEGRKSAAEIQQDYFDKYQEMADKALADKIAKDNESLQSDKDYIENRQAIYEQANKELIEMSDAALKEKVNQDNRTINGFVSATQDILSTVSAFINQNTENAIADMEDQVAAGVLSQEKFDKESRKLRAEAFEKDKALKITQAVINTAASVMNMLATAPFPVNLVMAALAAATGIAQTVLIGQQRAPRFAEGGVVVGGKPHAQGGTQYVGEDGNRFEVERGERIFVMKRTASERIGEMSKWNMMFGGRSWTDSPIGHAALGGAITDGGFVARNSSENANSLLLVQTFAKQLIDGMPAPVVSVKEINKVQNARNRSVGVSEIG